VFLRALETRGMMENDVGKIAVGWLVVEDLFTVLILVLLPVIAGMMGGHNPSDAADASSLGFRLYLMLAKLVVFVGLMLVIGKRVLPWLLARVARTGSRELSILAIATAAIGLAYGASELFGVSFALGAFLSGLVVSRSHETRRAAEDLRPLQDIFGVLFFVSVGMLLDPWVLQRRPFAVVEVMAVIVVGKPVATFLIVRLMRYTNATALVMAAGLGQIGEFSFILATMGEQLGLLSPAGRNLILAGAIGSIALNALAFRIADRLQRSIKPSADVVVLSQPSSVSV
jgi:CPA2 family monovalent cation:H+ antiporter-2